MEKFNELRNKWINAIKPLNALSTKALYFLLEPDDDSKFFENIDSFKECIEATKFVDFQMLAIEYFIEYKKQNTLKTESHIPNTITIPIDPIDNHELQKLTRPITAPILPYYSTAPILPFYSSTSNITYKSLEECDKCRNN